MWGCNECKKVNSALPFTVRTDVLKCNSIEEDVFGGITIKKSFLSDLYYKHFDMNVHHASRDSLSKEDFSKTAVLILVEGLMQLSISNVSGLQLGFEFGFSSAMTSKVLFPPKHWASLSLHGLTMTQNRSIPMTVVMILMAMMPVTMTTGTTCGGWEFSWVGASWIGGSLPHSRMQWKVLLMFALGFIVLRWPWAKEMVVDWNTTWLWPQAMDTLSLRFDAGAANEWKWRYNFLKTRWALNLIRLRTKMLYRGMVCRGRKMTARLGHIGAAGKAGQIGADRLKDDYRGKQHISQALSRSCFADCAHAPLGLFNQAPDGMYIKLELSGIEAICSAFDVWGGQSTKPLPNPGEKPVSWKLHWSHQNSVQSTSVNCVQHAIVCHPDSIDVKLIESALLSWKIRRSFIISPTFGGSMWILTISHKNKISPDATNFNHGFKGDRKTLFESSWIHSILQRYMMIIWCMDYVWVDDDSLVDAMVDAPMTSQPLVTLDHGQRHAFRLRNLRRRNWKSWWPGMTRGAVDLLICQLDPIGNYSSITLLVSIDSIAFMSRFQDDAPMIWVCLKMVDIHNIAIPMRKMMTQRSTMDFCVTLCLRQTHLISFLHVFLWQTDCEEYQTWPGVLRIDVMCIAHDLQRTLFHFRKNNMPQSSSTSPCFWGSYNTFMHR